MYTDVNVGDVTFQDTVLIQFDPLRANKRKIIIKWISRTSWHWKETFILVEQAVQYNRAVPVEV